MVRSSTSRMSIRAAVRPGVAFLFLLGLLFASGVQGQPQYADFSGSPVSGCAPLRVIFTDHSVGTILTYQWSFPGGWPTSATGAGPHTVFYYNPGVFSVYLTVVFRDTTKDSETKENYISVTECKNASLGNLIWDDSNGNGIQDAGESGKAGVTVQLFRSDGTAVASTSSDASGAYEFSSLPGDDYYMKLIPPAGYAISPSHQGSDDVHDSDFDPTTHNTATFSLVSGYNDTGIDGGLIPASQTLEVDSWPEVCYILDLDIGGLGHSLVTLTGTAVQEVSVGAAGEATDSDSDGLDQVQTELVTLNLTGIDPVFGAVKLRLNPSRGSFGEIEEQVNNTPGILDVVPFTPVGTATSYIDAFFEIELSDIALCLRNELPTRLQALLDHKPPASFNVHTAVILSPEPFYSVPCGTGAWTLPKPPPNPAAHLLGLSACGSTQQTEVDIMKVCFEVEMDIEQFGVLNLQMSGLLTQRVYFEGPAAGDAADGNGNGLDDVVVELVDLSLHGVDPVAGHITMVLNPSMASPGLIEELVNSTPGVLDVPPFTPAGQAQCTFDAFFEIQLTDVGLCLRTYAPAKLYGTIDHKPPADPNVFSAAIPPSVPLYAVTCGSGALPPPTTPAAGSLSQMAPCGSDQTELLDYGDAPKPYPTLLADDGARHRLDNPQMYMGPSPAVLDGETDGQPEPNAAGDDVNGMDDEDGVTFLPSSDFSPGGHLDMAIIANTGPRIDGCINAWVDFNGNGSWGDPGERILDNMHGDVLWPSWNVTIPADAVPGETYARFRISQRPLTEGSFTGEVEDGEVEDYKITIGPTKPDFDLGDAPDGTNSVGAAMTAYPPGGPPGVAANFPTVYAAGSPPFGPKHNHPRAFAWLGPLVTLEKEADIGPDEDGVNNILPAGDLPDLDGADDCIHVPLELPECKSTSFTFTVTAVEKTKMIVNVWFDWNRDGDWNDTPHCPTGLAAPEWAVQNQVISLGSPGSYTFTTNPFVPFHPDPTKRQPIWMRITMSEEYWNKAWLVGDNGGGAGPRGGYEFGETEDYYFFPIQQGDLDFGDAKEPFPTKLSANGARHFITPDLFLGTVIDPEPDGQPGADATGDDLNIIDDEDGVTFTSDLTPGGTASVDVFATGRGYLNAWFDFNRDNDWADANEHAIWDVLIPPGLNPLTFSVPGDATPGKTYARFRFCQEKGLSYDGAGMNGEVEDYLVQVPASGRNPIKWIQPPLKVRPADWPDSVWHCYDGHSLASIEEYRVVADDWICRDPKPITSVTWWGSYADWDTTVAPPNAPWGFRVTLYKDVPKSWDTTYSHPGEKVREWKIALGSAGESVAGSRAKTWKPDTVFKYTLYLPPADWFYQEGDSTIYWVSIAALYPEIPAEHVWGWLTRSRYFHDEAVYVKKGAGWYPIHAIFPVSGTAGYFEQYDMTFVLGTTDTHREFDFGDAPDPLFPTLLATGGAEHWFDSRFRLGTGLDVELDGQPSSDASGDGSDEDGVTWPASLLAGSYNTLIVNASAAGFLNAWMDFDGDQEWNGAQEFICLNTPLSAGDNYVRFLAPTDVKPEPVAARFRFSTEPDLTPLGLAIDGEVEDYFVKFETTSGVDGKDGAAPGQNRLMQNYPNPFNPSTKIEFELKAAGPVKLLIYDLTGRRVAVLADGRREAGRHTVTWEGRDASGRAVSGGLYLLRIEAGGFRQTKKLLLMK